MHAEELDKEETARMAEPMELKKKRAQVGAVPAATLTRCNSGLLLLLPLQARRYRACPHPRPHPLCYLPCPGRLWELLDSLCCSAQHEC